MQRQQHLRALERDGALLLAAATRTTWDASIPACPGWTVRDLVRHLGRVHLWAVSYVRDGGAERTDPRVLPAPEIDDELAAWFRAGHTELVRVLATAPPDVRCWQFAPNLPLTPLEFWTRRQAHETSMHRVDAEQAAGGPATPFEPAFAVDGVDELLFGFLEQPRRRDHRDLTATLLLRATDTGDSWLVRSGPGVYVVTRGEEGAGENGAGENGPGEAAVTVAGTASDVHLALWNRGDVVTVDGDADMWRRWREATAI